MIDMEWNKSKNQDLRCRRNIRIKLYSEDLNIIVKRGFMHQDLRQ